MGEIIMPSKSVKQARLMAMAAHNPKFAKKAGIKRSVAKEFNQADAGTGILKKAVGGLAYAPTMRGRMLPRPVPKAQPPRRAIAPQAMKAPMPAPGGGLSQFLGAPAPVVQPKLTNPNVPQMGDISNDYIQHEAGLMGPSGMQNLPAMGARLPNMNLGDGGGGMPGLMKRPSPLTDTGRGLFGFLGQQESPTGKTPGMYGDNSVSAMGNEMSGGPPMMNEVQTGDALRRMIARGGKVRYDKGGPVKSGLAALKALAKKFEEALAMGDNAQALRLKRQMEMMQPGSTEGLGQGEEAVGAEKAATFKKGGKVK
jgi:hypothetical protein